MFRSVRRPRCKCDYDEMCHILKGTVRLPDADDASCEQSGLGFAGNAGSPYVNASSKAGHKGYNYQDNRRVTQNRSSKRSARVRRSGPDRPLRRGAM